MTAEEWRAYLERYSRGLIAFEAEYGPSGHSEGASEEARRSGWLGVPPATEEAITAAEARLGVALPPSLRAFYAVTNGWPYDIGSYAGLRVLPVEEIGWYRDRPPYGLLGVDSFAELTAYLATDEPDMEERVWLESLMRSLVVSSEGEEAAVILLDPERVDERGEWAAARPEVVFSPDQEWRWRDFAALFVDEARGEWEDTV